MTMARRTVTLLMTDMVGSTRQWDADWEGMWRATQRHDEIADAVIQEHGGNILKPRGEGDSLLVVFNNPSDAVTGAVALNRALAQEVWPGSLDIKVRSAIHVGEIETGETDIYGPTVNRCARIRALAFAEQILVSEATAALVRARLVGDIDLLDLGEHRLKDLSLPERLYQVTHPALPAEYPPLPSLSAIRNNLPIQVARFVGRRREIGEVEALIQVNRVVSLVGLSGIGKSRLALQVAAESADAFKGGVGYLDVSMISPLSLIPEIARIVGSEAKNISELAQTGQRMANVPALVVLDHCDGMPDLALAMPEIIQALPSVKFLTASQERLGLAGACRFKVPLLAGPSSQATTEVSDSVALFIDRALLVRPEMALGESELKIIGQIVKRLDGLPLAIELAAARLGVMTLSSLAQRLEESYRVISGPTQGLAAAIGDSIASLDPTAALLLKRLAAFDGGCTLEAFEVFVQADLLEDYEILDGLQQLVERSLVQLHDWLTISRYTMIGAIREYVRANLAPEEREEQARRHYELFSVSLGNHANAAATGRMPDYVAAIDADSGNYRASLDYAIRNRLQEESLRMASQLFRYWESKGRNVEGRVACEHALEVADGELGESALAADVHNAIGCLAQREGNYDVARSHHERALAIRTRLQDDRGAAGSLNNLANLASDQGDLEEAKARYLAALELNRKIGNTAWAAINLVNLGTVSHRAGADEEALLYHAESLALFEKAGMHTQRLYPLAGMGVALSALERWNESQVRFMEALELALECGDRPWTIVAMEGLGAVAISGNEPHLGVRLLALGLAQREELDFPLSPTDIAEHEAWTAMAKAKLGAEGFEVAWQEGSACTVRDLIPEIFKLQAP